jgi:chromosome segregation ATPase
VKLKLLEQHLASCKSRTCPHKKRGCVFSGNVEVLESHLAQCPYEKLKDYIAEKEEMIQMLQSRITREKEEKILIRSTLNKLQTTFSALQHEIETSNVQFQQQINSLKQSADVNNAKAHELVQSLSVRRSRNFGMRFE